MAPSVLQVRETRASPPLDAALDTGIAEVPGTSTSGVLTRPGMLDFL